jgi:hypothetical protein
MERLQVDPVGLGEQGVSANLQKRRRLLQFLHLVGGVRGHEGRGEA